jgi:DUF4097 and DUF4098 domain-containing protein YvlB
MAMLHRLGLVAVGLSLVGATTGCEKCQVSTQDGSDTKTQTGYCSVNRFQASNAREASATLGDGRDVTIKSINGNLTVKAGSGGDVSATFHAFVYRAFNTADSEVQKDFDLLVTDASADADGNVTVSTSRKNGAKSTLGADFDVVVPSSASGAFTIIQNNGDVDVASVGGATAVSITSDNGGITASVGSAANSVNVSGDNGDVAVSIAGVPSGATGGKITAQHGDISLTLPTTGGYSVPATAGAKVDFGTPPTGCAVEEAASNSKTLTCNGGGAVFTVNAQSSSAGLTVKYR